SRDQPRVAFVRNRTGVRSIPARMRDPLVPFVIAPAEMTRRNVTALVEVAQVPGSKLIDFRTTRTVSAHLFELLEARWRSVAGLVPRLALVFPFHHYVMARPLAASTVV